MIAEKGFVSLLFPHKTYGLDICNNRLWSDSSKYLKYVFLDVLSTIFLYNFWLTGIDCI